MPRGYACVALDQPKFRVNVGSVLRAAHAFDVAAVFVRGRRYSRACTDTTKAARHLPLHHVEDLHAAIPHGCVPVAIEFLPDGHDLVHYEHPERAFYVFGGEDATLGERVLSWCRDVVYIPSSYCLNLSAAVNVVLYDRLAKELRDA